MVNLLIDKISLKHRFIIVHISSKNCHYPKKRYILDTVKAKYCEQLLLDPKPLKLPNA